MIEVKLVLLDPVEILGFQQFHAALFERRVAIAQAQAAAMRGEQPAPEAPLTPRQEAEQAAVAEKMAEVFESDFGTHPQAGVTATAVGAPEPEPADPREIFNKYYQTHGFAAARKKLDAFGAQRFSDIKTEQLPAFLKSLVEPA